MTRLVKTKAIELNSPVIKQNKTKPTNQPTNHQKAVSQNERYFLKKSAFVHLLRRSESRAGTWIDRPLRKKVACLISSLHLLIPRAEFRSWKSLRPGQPRPLHRMPSGAALSHCHSPFTLSSFFCHSLISVLLCRDNCTFSLWKTSGRNKCQVWAAKRIYSRIGMSLHSRVASLINTVHPV